jgi:hypothetical protein
VSARPECDARRGRFPFARVQWAADGRVARGKTVSTTLVYLIGWGIFFVLLGVAIAAGFLLSKK